MATLWVDHVQRRGFRKPVSQHQLERTPLHRLFDCECRHLGNSEPRFGRAHVAVLILPRQVARKDRLAALGSFRESPLDGLSGAGREVIDTAMSCALAWMGRKAMCREVS